MAHIDRDGVQVYYEAQGNGPAVLLSHGFSATSEMWKAQITALRDKYQVIAWDMRGHGNSDYPDDEAAYSKALTVEDMTAILDACEAREAVVGGMSLGGYMSLAFYMKYPERVKALMLFDTGPGYRNDEARAQWNDNALRHAARFEECGLEALKEGASREMNPTAHRSADGLARAAKGMLRQFDASVIDSLPTISVPTLVLVGKDDAPFLPPTEYMARKISGAEKVIIDDAGHAANLDQPEAFNEAVLKFLAAHVY